MTERVYDFPPAVETGALIIGIVMVAAGIATLLIGVRNRRPGQSISQAPIILMVGGAVFSFFPAMLNFITGGLVEQ